MIRTGLTTLSLATAFCGSTLLAQNSPAQEPAGLKLELRPATGSNHFQLGEVIPLKVFISSAAPNRYLDPCKLFWESCFGYPQCRFESRWSFDVTPNTGWADIGSHGCMTMSGPTFDVQSSDLVAEPKRYSYTLTTRFRFDAPGKYTVRLSMTVGLDDETNQIRKSPNSTVKPDSVGKTAEIVLEIAPAGDEWKRTVIEQGVAAWTARPPAYTNPPWPENLRYRQEEEALCNLGTPEAALALAGVYWEWPEQRYKQLFPERVTSRPAYYPRGVIRSCSKPSVFASASCGRVCLESTVAIRFGPFSPCGG